MMNLRFGAIPRLALAAAALLLGATSFAQDWPSKPVRVIVDGPAGGITDIWARRYTQRLSESLQQPMVVENRTGASGTIAAAALAKSPPDGYTLMYGGMSPLVAYPGAGGSVRYDPVKDFAGAALGGMGYPILVASTASRIKSLPELIQYAKDKPDGIFCGTAGQASVQHFGCAQIAKALGLTLQPVHYKGGAPALLDAASGQITVTIGYTAETEHHVASGRLIPLAAMAPNRLPRFPSVPTFAEAGYPGLEMPSFAGFYFPAGTPPAIVERINAESITAMAQPEMVEFRKHEGTLHTPMTAKQFNGFVASEQAKWRRMSQEAGIRVDQ